MQTNPLAFSHPLTGGDNADEQVTEVPDLQIPFPGVWQVSYQARSSVSLPSTSASAMWVQTSLFKNGARIPGSEALAGIYGANVGSQATAGQTLLHKFDVGDTVTLHAYRIGQNGSASIISNGDGRTAVMAHWVSPGF